MKSKKILLALTLLISLLSFGQISTDPVTGNVGIGTNTSAEKLTVEGNILAAICLNFQDNSKFMVTNASVPGLTLTPFSMPHYGIAAPNTTGSADLWIAGNNAIRMFTGGNPNPTVNILSGKVGIGTTAPSANLEIYKNLSASTLKISNSDPASFNTELRLGGNNTFEKSAIISAPNPAGWWRQDLYFCLANGNNNTSATISDAAMVIKSYNSGQFGYVGIGSTNPDQKLTVKGKIHAEEIIVDLSVPADYVFQKYYTGKSELKSDYVMPTLAEIENFTKENNHLPNVPSAKEVQQKGVSLGEMSNVLLQKVEELTLYAIEQNKEIKRLKAENENYKSLAERLSAIENALKK